MVDLAHSALFIKATRWIIAVDIKLDSARPLRVLRTHIGNCLVEKRVAYVKLLELRQYIYLLEMVKVVAFTLDRNVTSGRRRRRLRAFGKAISDEILMPFSHLLPKILDRVHPVHHIVDLLGGQDLLVC